MSNTGHELVVIGASLAVAVVLTSARSRGGPRALVVASGLLLIVILGFIWIDQRGVASVTEELKLSLLVFLSPLLLATLVTAGLARTRLSPWVRCLVTSLTAYGAFWAALFLGAFLDWITF